MRCRIQLPASYGTDLGTGERPLYHLLKIPETHVSEKTDHSFGDPNRKAYALRSNSI